MAVSLQRVAAVIVYATISRQCNGMDELTGEMMNDVDSDHDGQASLIEIRAFLEKQMSDASKSFHSTDIATAKSHYKFVSSLIEPTFHAADINVDGFLSLDEYEQFNENINQQGVRAVLKGM
eukprot:TRINITY_DN1966_c0_g1_i3.p1 TRINITY_DN1966_c0_g1~~TRINITY_DN1966_c0_g1_i3.p1  ORF type:complete len:122 (+),score=22.52 TRINITY_DN1966_c0_g1_i3:78-443(+)